MAKKLVYNYEFTPGVSGTGNIKIEGNYPEKTLLIITNVTDNEIIYNFAKAGAGATTSYDAQLDRTTITLDYDTSSMSSSDKLQIFIDVQEEKLDFSETFVDPVNKLRVSEPQNLIDTDFEYGLQPTKWETIELVNNIPSFYSSTSDYTIPDIVKVETVIGSENVTVTTSEDHGLTVGSPIDVQGVSSRNAEGKFLIISVPTPTTFVYRSKGIQSATEQINGAYTTITPGQFYAGSQINIKQSKGIETDGLPETTLSVETEYAHGFTPGTSLYLTNTLGSQKYNLNVGFGSTAPDGRPYVDYEDNLPINLNINSALTETKQMTGTYAYKFTSASVDATANTITWNNHQLQAGDVLLYVPPSGDSEIGGLQRFQIYYVKSTPSSNTITLCETTNGDYTNNPVIDFSSTGTSTYGRHELILGYEIVAAQKNPNEYASYFYSRCYWTGSGSGRDLTNYSYDPNTGRAGYFGLGQTPPQRFIFCQKDASTMSTAIHGVPMYSTRDNANFTFGKAGTVPDGYEFIEDYNRFESYWFQNGYLSWSSWLGYLGYIYVYYINNFQYEAEAYQNYTLGTTFMFWMKPDPERDSLFIENHGLESGSLATLTTNSGSSLSYRSDNGSWYAAPPEFESLSGVSTSPISIVSPNRIRLTSASRLNSASGTYSLTGTIKNPTSDTFYLGNNNLTTNTKVFLSAVGGGSLPPTTTGVVNPTPQTITNVYAAITTALDGIKDDMGSDTWDMVMSGNEQTPFNGSYTNTSGGVQWFYLNRSGYFLQKIGPSGYLGGTQAYLPGSGFANGSLFDLFGSTDSAGLGYYMITTPFANNSSIPYWIDLYQLPYEPGVTGTELYLNGWFAYNYAVLGTYDDNDNTYSNWTSLGNGWRYTYDVNYFSPGNGWHGYISMTIVIDNSSWSGYNSQPYLFNYYFSLQYMLPGTYGYGGQRYMAHIIIPVTNGTDASRYGESGSFLNNSDIANTIATEITNQLNNPSFSGQQNQDALVEVVSGQRIKLKDVDTNNFYNFTGFGTAPIVMQTEELVGILDGYYNITSTGTQDFFIELNSEIPKRNIGFTYQDVKNVGGTVYINYNEHKLNTGQAIVYNVLSGNTISGLSSGTTYYAVPSGPDHLSLATSLANANGGNVVGIASTTSGAFEFIVPTISGIAAGAGSVGVTSDSRTLIGTDTLFKRFFKSGDTIKLEDVSVAPSRYRSLTVDSVVDDLILTTKESPGFTDSQATYFVETKVNVRPDGTFLHRPFDGGVEITAGTSPDSLISRQTRKYFRYQSGKGIQCSLAINFNPSRIAQSVVGLGTTAVVTTPYPHGLTTSNSVRIKGSDDNTYNGTFKVIDSDDLSFKYNMNSTPSNSVPDGIISYNIDSWANSVIRAGLFDYQNGFFFEFDGSTLYAVRRSSVQQIPGTATVQTNSNIVLGTNTNFTGQLRVGQYIVLRGNSYKVTRLVSKTELNIQPAYRGLSAKDVIVTKTTDTRVPQDQWNIDKSDGTGPSGFLLDLTKIQMAYLDYSWYGAGKIRFGFKDTYGHVKYMHEFRHNNRLEEAYMRSGNIPARYEIENVGTPTYVPSLFHWGTSVIMDGRFDDDKAYLFTASSNSLIFTNGDAETATTNDSSALVSRYNYSTRTYDWYVRLSFPYLDAYKFTTGTPLYTANNQLKGQKVAYTEYAYTNQLNIYVYVLVQSSRNQPAVYPSVNNSTLVSIGAPATGGTNVDLTKDIPLISIRLAPSVDNNLTGAVGQREIINRMQLQLKSLGMTLSHDCEVDLILNGSITNTDFLPVNSPSLSQLLRHNPGDRVIGGTKIFSLRASGGSVVTDGKRLSSTTDFNLSQITDLGNSILGGDGVFPNGPDLLTIAIVPVDTSEINANTPLTVSSRITWTESQA